MPLNLVTNRFSLNNFFLILRSSPNICTEQRMENLNKTKNRISKSFDSFITGTKCAIFQVDIKLSYQPQIQNEQNNDRQTTNMTQNFIFFFQFDLDTQTQEKDSDFGQPQFRDYQPEFKDSQLIVFAIRFSFYFLLLHWIWHVFIFLLLVSFIILIYEWQDFESKSVCHECERIEFDDP